MLSWNICYITLFDQDSTFQQSFGNVFNIFRANLTKQKILQTIVVAKNMYFITL